jgi:surface antigen
MQQRADMNTRALSRIVAVLLGALLLMASACATKRGSGAAVGAGGGAVVGGLVGGRSGALIGAALGGIVGYGVGRQMEEEDRRRVAYALEANRQMEWRNTQTGGYYEVQPTRTVIQNNRECREFRMLADVGGRQPEEVFGTACRGPDGQWEVISG